MSGKLTPILDSVTVNDTLIVGGTLTIDKQSITTFGTSFSFGSGTIDVDTIQTFDTVTVNDTLVVDGTLTIDKQSIVALGNGISVNSGTISVEHQGTISATTTVTTIDPSGLQSCLVNMGTVDTTITVSPGYVGQELRLEIVQGATAQGVTLDATCAFSADIPSFTATGTAAVRDMLQLVNLTGSVWAVAAVNKGFTV